jgi:IS30 family transposase
MKSGEPSASHIRPFAVWCRVTVGLFRRSGGARSLTWDRGLEMAKHKTFTVATDVKVYFYDPQSPWQHGSNENTNGLLRQYFPKKANLSGYTQSDLDKVAQRLNQRPRKTLSFQTPASKLRASVATTH